MTLEIASEPKQQILISAKIESLYLHRCPTLVWLNTKKLFQDNKKEKEKNVYQLLFSFSRAQTIRPDFLRTQQGIKKARSAIENCLSKTTGFNFMDMKAIIEDIVAEEEEAERLQRYGDSTLGVVLILVPSKIF